MVTAGLKTFSLLETNFMTVHELSLYLNIKEKTVYHLVALGEIPHYRIGKLVRFRRGEIDAWISTKKARPGAERIEAITRSAILASEGKPGHLRKGVN